MSLLAKQRHLWTLGISLLVSIGGIIYGYDIGVISGALLFIHKNIPLSDTQTGIVVSAVFAGGLLGSLITGPMADLFGRRLMIRLSCFILFIGISFVIIAKSMAILLLGRLLLGIGAGIIAVAVPVYIAELVPSFRRGRYVSFFQLFIAIGIVLAGGVDLLLTSSGNWQTMFGVLSIPTVILLLGSFKLPESPRWLIAHGYPEKARVVLRRTHTKLQAEIAQLTITESLQGTRGDWRELTSNPIITPFIIATLIAVLNQLTGINAFFQYTPTLLKLIGSNSDISSMQISLIIASINLIGTLISMLLVDRIGRRPLLIVGILGCCFAEVFLAVVSILPISLYAYRVASIYGLIFAVACYSIGPGVVVWLFLSELFPTQVRGKGIAICLFLNALAGTITGALFLDIKNLLNLSGTYTLCASFSFIYFVIAYRFLPETRRKSLERIQRYFYRKQGLQHYQ